MENVVQPFDIPSQKPWFMIITDNYTYCMLYKKPCNSWFQPIKNNNNNNNNKHPVHPGTRGWAACISCDRTLLDLCRRRPAMVYYYASANALTLTQTTGGSRVTYLLPDTHGFHMFSHVKSCELGDFLHISFHMFFSWKIPILTGSIPKKMRLSRLSLTMTCWQQPEGQRNDIRLPLGEMPWLQLPSDTMGPMGTVNNHHTMKILGTKLAKHMV